MSFLDAAEREDILNNTASEAVSLYDAEAEQAVSIKVEPVSTDTQPTLPEVPPGLPSLGNKFVDYTLTL